MLYAISFGFYGPRSKSILSAILLLAAPAINGLCVAEEPTMTPETPVKVVDSVSMQRYAGLWYEIAKIPNRFQKKCAGGTTALYEIRDDGKINVINRCYDKEGRLIEAKGIAKVVDPSSNAKLKVSFVKFIGIRLFWGDYWIIGLGKNYDYAVVGTPNRKYGWILARSKTLPETTLAEIFSLLRDNGYDPTDFQMTDQAIPEEPGLAE